MQLYHHENILNICEPHGGQTAAEKLCLLCTRELGGISGLRRQLHHATLRKSDGSDDYPSPIWALCGALRDAGTQNRTGLLNLEAANMMR